MNRTRITASECDCVQRIAATCGESPMWSAREQALYWTDNLGGRIHRLEPESGNDQSFLLGQNVMGIGLRERGFVLVLAKHLAFYEPGGELELLTGVEDDQPRNPFNDGKVDRRGRYWAEVEVPLPQPTSCIFGGRDLDVLYITSSRQKMTSEQLARYPLSGSVFAVRPGLSGLPEPLFAG